MRLGSALLLVGACASAVPLAARAQVRASEAASISQTVDGTTFTVTYSRPQARGRDGLFGKLVPYGRIWTPGANWATTLEVSHDVRVNDHPVPKGKYSVWAIPDSAEWTIVLDPDARLFHTQRPGESASQIRFAAPIDSGSHVEALTWDVPVVRPDGAMLRLRWGTVIVPLNIAVQPTGRGRPPDATQSYVGTYRLRFSRENGDVRDHRADVFEQDGALHLRFTPNAFPEYEPVVELRAGTHAHTFHPVFQRNGRALHVEPDAALAFHVENGRATSLELRGAGGRPIGTATRDP